VIWRFGRAAGAVVAYGGLVWFVGLIGLQTYRWFRLGEWTHIGVAEGLRSVLGGCCVRDGDTGLFAALAHWIDAPVDWLGLHKMLDVVPASLLLFAISILGNAVFVYCCDRIDAGGQPN
jgi:hypothetical protein